MPKPTITGAYPHYPVMEPKPIKATGIWAFAQGVRKQVMGTQHRRIAEVRALADRVGAVSINGIAYRLVWDFDHKVHDEDGRPVMGVCEHDPHEPGQVMISIDATAGSERQDVERSTTLHELGHALFDMPAAVYAERRCSLAFTGEQVQRLFRPRSGALNRERVMDWREWRANEFMGAFLAPPAAFHQCLVRFANEYELALVSRPSLGKLGLPVLDHSRLDVDAFDALLDHLAETFGITQEFAGVRVRKYRLITGREN